MCATSVSVVYTLIAFVNKAIVYQGVAHGFVRSAGGTL
jgi:hypothetical protein